MEANIKNLYKIHLENKNSYIYVAADSQQEAIDKVADKFDTENKFHFSVSFIDEIFV